MLQELYFTAIELLFIFILFKYKFYGKNCRRQRDSNSDGRSRSRACWPLDHHHGPPPSRPILPSENVFFKYVPTPASFSFIFVLFKQILQFLQQMYVKKCPSRIRYWDSNPLPLERESLPITTRPGLPPLPSEYVNLSKYLNIDVELHWVFFIYNCSL